LFSHTARVDPRAVGDFIAKQFEKERAEREARMANEAPEAENPDSALPQPE